ncbi:MAG: GntR family transcriptional regulator [Treponema sp.]|nr:GntR family transcriptional regulator [Treponema sp.]
MHNRPDFGPISHKYKKSWLINTCTARDLIGFSAGDRLPTVQEFTQKHASSRGIVQKALEGLQKSGAITLEKRGKMGTYIGAIDQAALFRLGGLEYITATMPPPITGDLAGLATGICDVMGECPVPFNFAFIHGSDKRGAALSRMVYDFAVTSRTAAARLTARYPDLDTLMFLDGCVYSPPFVLCSKRPGVWDISDGDTIAVDPSSVDQYVLTKRFCKGKKVRIIERPYVTCRALFISGDIDFMIYRDEAWIRDYKIPAIPFKYGQTSNYLLPAILINKHNYNIGNILKPFLRPSIIAENQTAVLEHRKEIQIY